MKKTTRLEAVKKIFGTKHLLLLIMIFIANTMGWYIYSTMVEGEITAHVKAWKVIFESNSNELVDYINIDVGTMYPGMDEYLYQITAINRSEVSAIMTYTILEMKLFDEEYISAEGKAELSQTLDGTEYTSEELIDMLKEEYPFLIEFTMETTELEAEFGESVLDITVNWPFESGDDEADTYWGEKSAEHIEETPEVPGIVIKVKVSVSQTAE